MARKQTDTRYIYRHMTTREASGVEGGRRDVTACNDTCKRLARGLEVAKYGAVVGGAGGAREGRKRGRGGGGGGPRVRTRAARRRGEVESSGPGAD